MAVAEFRARSSCILYDDAVIPAVSLEWLQPEFWRLRRAVREELGGRGQALAVDSSVGPAVLRRFRRGGLVARIVRESYFFTGYQRSRGLREWLMLDRLFRNGLPVPRPLAASCERHGPLYRAGLLTALIPDAQPLAVVARALTEEDWIRLGHTLRAFFDAGVIHPDLNAHNILHAGNSDWYLIDFDRARLSAGPARPQPMLARLFRSFDRLGIEGRRDTLRQGVGLV